MQDIITIRHATPDDAVDMWRLAGLDDRPLPSGDALLAFVNDELRALLPLANRRVLADPFHLTADVTDLLEMRAAQEPVAA
jgi:hypothetical protein